MFRSSIPRALRGALTNRPYEVPVTSKSYSNFAPNPCFTVDTSVIKGDNFDFWAYREEQTKKREQEFEKERKTLLEKYSAKVPEGDRLRFARQLEDILNIPTFRETVAFVGGDRISDYNGYHFQALAEREAMRGEPLNVRTVHLMMASADITPNTQDYVLLFRSYWKNGTTSHLLAVLEEMKLLKLAPTKEMVDFTVKACSASKDSAGEKAAKAVPTSVTTKKLTHKEQLKVDAVARLAIIDLNREILEKEMPPGDFFISMLDSHKQLS